MPLTIQAIRSALVIVSLCVRYTVHRLYIPPLIVVLDSMRLFLLPFFSPNLAEVKRKEENEKVCKQLFHHNNCWLWQKCPISYSDSVNHLVKTLPAVISRTTRLTYTSNGGLFRTNADMVTTERCAFFSMHSRSIQYQGPRYDMSHSRILGKVEYGGGPIFKVVVEC